MICRIISLTKTTWAHPPFLSEVVFFFAFHFASFDHSRKIFNDRILLIAAASSYLRGIERVPG